MFAGEDDLTEQRRGALRSIAPDIDCINILDFFDEDHAGLDGGGWAIKGEPGVFYSWLTIPMLTYKFLWAVQCSRCSTASLRFVRPDATCPR